MVNTKQISNLMLDIIHNKTAQFAKEKSQFANDAVREKLVELFGTEKLTYNVWEEHKRKVFTIISEVLNITAPNAMQTNPFFMEMAEVKNGADGDQNEFVVPDMSHLVVSRFSGNHWNTDRQKLIGNRSFTVPTEWFSVRIYEEIDRILKGINSVADMFTKINDGLMRDINDRVYTSFNGANVYLPDAFKESGTFSKDSMLGLVDRVQTASNKNVRIVGTRQGLSSMMDSADWASDAMKDEKNKTGVVRYWEGIQTIVLPQAFVKGSYDFAINPKVIRVIPDGYKPVKIWYEGDNRIRSLDYTDTIDQVVDIETQTKVGVGFVMADLFGEYIVG